MQTWTAYERQQILHQFRSGCRFSICFAGKNADELNSSPMGKRSRGRAQAVVCTAVSLCLLVTWQPVCVVWVHVGKRIRFPKSLKLPLTKEGWGFGGNR